MKKQKRLMGFLSYQDAEYPFEFDENEYIVKLYPPSEDVWRQDSSIYNMFDYNNQAIKKHGWIPNKQLVGTTASSDSIVFCVRDSRLNINGFISFTVNWYYCCTDELKFDNIDGFKIQGHDVNVFYPPQSVIESKHQFNEGGLQSISVSSSGIKQDSCGHYRVAKNIDAEIEVAAFTISHSNEYSCPIDSISQMTTIFSKAVDLDILITAYQISRKFFMFIEYRKNIDLGTIEVFRKNNDGKRQYSGILVFPSTKILESHKDLSVRVIQYKYLETHTVSLFTAIKNDILGFGHLCNSIDDLSHYQPSRIIMILSEFEREYRNIYGQDFGRSKEYTAVKNEIIELVASYIKNHSGSSRKYAKQLKKYINDRDNSFEQNVIAAMSDCSSVMNVFVRNKYKSSYEEAVNEIGSRMVYVRNGIAHSRLDLKLDAIHLSDIKVIEELIYAMRMKKMTVKSIISQKAINALFAEYRCI